VTRAARVSWRSLETLLALALAATAGPGCGQAAEGDTMPEAVVTLSERNSAGDAGSPEPLVACAAAAEGCPCASDGETIACPGPKIHSGNYTSCAPGHRECVANAWGPCIGNTVYQNADALTEDYASPCQPGTAVHWGAVTLHGLTPDDSRIEVRVQAAESAARLDSAPVVNAGQFEGPTGFVWTSADVGALLARSGCATMSHLRVTLVLVPASHSGSLPAVVDWRPAIACTPAQ